MVMARMGENVGGRPIICASDQHRNAHDVVWIFFSLPLLSLSLFRVLFLRRRIGHARGKRRRNEKGRGFLLLLLREDNN